MGGGGRVEADEAMQEGSRGEACLKFPDSRGSEDQQGHSWAW